MAVVFTLTGTYASRGWSTPYRSRWHVASIVVCSRWRMGCRAPVDRSTPRSYQMDSITGRKLSRKDEAFQNTTTHRVMLSQYLLHVCSEISQNLCINFQKYSSFWGQSLAPQPWQPSDTTVQCCPLSPMLSIHWTHIDEAEQTICWLCDGSCAAEIIRVEYGTNSSIKCVLRKHSKAYWVQNEEASDPQYCRR